MFPEKALSWFYNERHHGKGHMDGIGGTIKNVIFRKVKSGYAIVNTSNLDPAHLFAIRGRQNGRKALEHFKHILKFAEIGVISFRINCGIRGRRY